MNSSKEEQFKEKTNSSSSKSIEKINTTKSQKEKRIESSDEQERKEIKELLSHLDDELVEGRLNLPDSAQSSRSSSVCSKKTTASTKSKLTNVSASQKSIQQKVPIVNNKPHKKTISPEEQEKRDVQEIFKNLEDEIEEGVLKSPSRLKNNKSSASISEKVEVQSEHKSSIKHVSINSAKVQKKSEDSEEQEKREVRELLNNLSDEVVEGIIKLPNGKNDKLESASIGESEKLKKKSVKSNSKVSVESIKTRNTTPENLDVSEERELKEFYDNLRDELEIGILRLSDGFHHHKSTTPTASESEVASIKENSSRVSSKTASKISHVSSKTGMSSTEQEIREVLDNLSEEMEIGILQMPSKF